MNFTAVSSRRRNERSGVLTRGAAISDGLKAATCCRWSSIVRRTSGFASVTASGRSGEFPRFASWHQKKSNVSLCLKSLGHCLPRLAQEKNRTSYAHPITAKACLEWVPFRLGAFTDHQRLVGLWMAGSPLVPILQKSKVLQENKPLDSIEIPPCEFYLRMDQRNFINGYIRLCPRFDAGSGL